MQMVDEEPPRALAIEILVEQGPQVHPVGVQSPPDLDHGGLVGRGDAVGANVEVHRLSILGTRLARAGGGDDGEELEVLARQPTAVVADDETLWIAKFGRPGDRYNQPRTEHALLELASACGLSSADSRLTIVADRDVLLVRRFDRDRVESGYRVSSN